MENLSNEKNRMEWKLFEGIRMKKNSIENGGSFYQLRSDTTREKSSECGGKDGDDSAHEQFVFFDLR